MLFHFPFEVPFLGEWFNLLPFVVVALMLVQTKLFSPPATSPEAEAQQKMMKYMMVFMGVMFYKVPSGLGLYFITSSLWAIGERLLLPKVTHAHPLRGIGRRADEAIGDAGGAKAARTATRPARAAASRQRRRQRRKAKPPGRIAQFLDRVLEEARKDPTYRKVAEEREARAARRTRAIPGPGRGGVDGVETSDRMKARNRHESPRCHPLVARRRMDLESVP